MADVLSGLPIGEISYPALIGLVVILIIRGDIVPRRTLDAVTKERDEWRAMALGMLEGVKVTAHVVESLPPVQADQDADT